MRLEFERCGGFGRRIAGDVEHAGDADSAVHDGYNNLTDFVDQTGMQHRSVKFSAAFKHQLFDSEYSPKLIQRHTQIDILFAANGETYDSLQGHIQMLTVEGVSIPVLDIEGLLKTKTGYREKDQIDRQMLLKLKDA